MRGGLEDVGERCVYPEATVNWLSSAHSVLQIHAKWDVWTQALPTRDNPAIIKC